MAMRKGTTAADLCVAVFLALVSIFPTVSYIVNCFLRGYIAFHHMAVGDWS